MSGVCAPLQEYGQSFALVRARALVPTDEATPSITSNPTPRTWKASTPSGDGTEPTPTALTITGKSIQARHATRPSRVRVFGKTLRERRSLARKMVDTAAAVQPGRNVLPRCWGAQYVVDAHTMLLSPLTTGLMHSDTAPPGCAVSRAAVPGQGAPRSRWSCPGLLFVALP
jgi:hypothetical protein